MIILSKNNYHKSSYAKICFIAMIDGEKLVSSQALYNIDYFYYNLYKYLIF